MTSLLFPYLIMASRGLVWNSEIARMYSGLVNNFWTFSFFSTLPKKLLVIHSFLVSSRQLFIFMASCTSLNWSGFAPLLAFTSVMGSLFSLGPELKNPFLSPAQLSFFLLDSTLTSICCTCCWMTWISCCCLASSSMWRVFGLVQSSGEGLEGGLWEQEMVLRSSSKSSRGGRSSSDICIQEFVKYKGSSYALQNKHLSCQLIPILKLLPFQSSYNRRRNMEPDVDISDIITPPQQTEYHYLDLKLSKPHPDHVQSAVLKKIFYAKRTMKQLLEERTQLCLGLGLSSRKSRSEQVDKSKLEHFFGEIFKDGPSDLREFSWTILEDRGTVYAFLASQEKYVPICKACSRTVYISIRSMTGRIVCSNPSCKVKLLAEFQFGGKTATSQASHSRKQSGTEQREAPISGIRKSQALESRNEEIRLGAQDKQLIRKAARRFMG